MFSTRSALTLAAGGLVAISGLLTLSIARPSTPPPRLAGTILHRAAPTFALKDQTGHTISLQSLRGHPVILTFLSATCTTLCPVVADSIQRAVEEMGPVGEKVEVVAITTAPEDDTHRAVTHFLREHHAQHWHFLTASRHVLTPLWRAYWVYVAPANAPQSIKNDHTSATFLLDGQGQERALMAGVLSQSDLLRDLQILSGVTVSASTGLAEPAPEVGHPAPNLTLRTLQGKAISLRSLRGRSVLLNFWASWCTACRSEMPLIVRRSRLQDKNLVILGIDTQDTAGSAAAFVRRYHARYPILVDTTGNAAATYDIAGLPTSFLVGPDGVVRYVSQGALTASIWRHHIQPAPAPSHGA